jgi:ribonuclease E
LVSTLSVAEAETVSEAPALAKVIDEDSNPISEVATNGDKVYPNRKRSGNRNKRRGGRDREPRPVAEAEAGQEAVPRQQRGPGRNVRPNLPPVVAEAKMDAPPTEIDVEVIGNPENVASEAEDENSLPRKGNTRRGPNRRRPRNPNYKKPDTDSGNGEEAAVSGDRPEEVSRSSYAGDFAEKQRRIAEASDDKGLEVKPRSVEINELADNKPVAHVPAANQELQPPSVASISCCDLV